MKMFDGLRGPVLSGFLFAVLGFLLGRATVGHQEATQQIRSAGSFLDRGVAAAKSGQCEEAYHLLRHDMAAVGTNPMDAQTIWQAIQLVTRECPTSPHVQQLPVEFLSCLDRALTATRSEDEFSQLFKLRTIVQEQVPEDKAPISTSIPTSAPAAESTPGNPAGVGPANALALFSLGVSELKQDKTSTRGDLLTQAGLHGLSDNPSAAAGIWRQWHAHLDEEEQTPIASKTFALLAFINSLDDALAASRTVEDFEVVWKVRQDVVKDLDAKRKSIIDSLGNEPTAIALLPKAKNLSERLDLLATGSENVESALFAIESAVTRREMPARAIMEVRSG